MKDSSYYIYNEFTNILVERLYSKNHRPLIVSKIGSYSEKTKGINDIDLFYCYDFLPTFTSFRFEGIQEFANILTDVREHLSKKIYYFPQNYVKSFFDDIFLTIRQEKSYPVHLLAYETPELLYHWEKDFIAKNLLETSLLSKNVLYSNHEKNLEYLKNYPEKLNNSNFDKKNFLYLCRYLIMGYFGLKLHNEEIIHMQHFSQETIRYTFKIILGLESIQKYLLEEFAVKSFNFTVLSELIESFEAKVHKTSYVLRAISEKNPLKREKLLEAYPELFVLFQYLYQLISNE